MPESVYRHFDAEGNLLYVGYSANHLGRLMQHINGSDWSGRIARIEVEHFPSRRKAMEAEAAAIEEESPRHNKKPGRPPMNVKPTVVRLTQEALDRIEKIAGPNQRAAFIREAVDSELERREAESQNSVQNGGDDGEKQ